MQFKLKVLGSEFEIPWEETVDILHINIDEIVIKDSEREYIISNSKFQIGLNEIFLFGVLVVSKGVLSKIRYRLQVI